MTGRDYTFASVAVRIDIVVGVVERYSQLIGFQHHDEIAASESARARSKESAASSSPAGVPRDRRSTGGRG
jgi:hypothetical protein